MPDKGSKKGVKDKPERPALEDDSCGKWRSLLEPSTQAVMGRKLHQSPPRQALHLLQVRLMVSPIWVQRVVPWIKCFKSKRATFHVLHDLTAPAAETVGKSEKSS